MYYLYCICVFYTIKQSSYSQFISFDLIYILSKCFVYLCTFSNIYSFPYLYYASLINFSNNLIVLCSAGWFCLGCFSLLNLAECGLQKLICLLFASAEHVGFPYIISVSGKTPDTDLINHIDLRPDRKWHVIDSISRMKDKPKRSHHFQNTWLTVYNWCLILCSTSLRPIFLS